MWPSVTVANCSLPFTFNGRLYERCIQTMYDLNGPCDKFACLLRGRVWARCRPPTSNYYLLTCFLLLNFSSSFAASPSPLLSSLSLSSLPSPSPSLSSSLLSYHRCHYHRCHYHHRHYHRRHYHIIAVIIITLSELETLYTALLLTPKVAFATSAIELQH